MKISDLSRCALSVGAVVLLLAGCGGNNAVPQRNVGTATTMGAVRHRGTRSPSYRVLYSFGKRYGDGSEPFARLKDVKGTLYGTTLQGGAYNCGTYDCGGTLFSITQRGTEKVLHSFGKRPDGNLPGAPLVDVKGVLYGTTVAGGTYRGGTIFSITTAGKEKVLYSFGNGTDGAVPDAGLIDVKGTLYGTTSQGGTYGAGTVFSVGTNGEGESVLHSFGNGTDGADPVAGLIDVKGTLYGTTRGGGAYNNAGTVFSIGTNGEGETVLHSFGKGTDGAGPEAGLIYVKSASALYGTTQYGGRGPHRCDGGRLHVCGTVFRITTGGAEKVLYSFGKGADGAYPVAGLIDVKGTLYGTTPTGGYRYGTIFSIGTNGEGETVLYSFLGLSDGADPQASLIDVKGTLYGTTEADGAHEGGVVFALKP